MLDISERRQPSPLKSKVTGLKCETCGKAIPDKTWEELALSKHDYCCVGCAKKGGYKRDPDEEIMVCIKRGSAYWRPVPALPCREKGLTNCTTDCPYQECKYINLKSESLYQWDH
jgi:hypothetical protein